VRDATVVARNSRRRGIIYSRGLMGPTYIEKRQLTMVACRRSAMA